MSAPEEDEIKKLEEKKAALVERQKKRVAADAEFRKTLDEHDKLAYQIADIDRELATETDPKKIEKLQEKRYSLKERKYQFYQQKARKPAYALPPESLSNE